MRRLLPLILICFAAAAHADTFETANLAPNPSFEQARPDGFPATWDGDRAVYSLDATVAHTGQHALKFVNNDPKRYVLCSAPVKFEHGRFYEFKGWVKTQGLKGEDSGATLCMEWYGPKGWLGGAYPTGVKGDSDWTLIRGVGGRIPVEATSVSITCYVRQAMTGTAWFDDIEVHRGIERPLSSAMLSPTYRNSIYPGGPSDVKLRAALNLRDVTLPRGALRVRAELLAPNGKSVSHPEYSAISRDAVDITLPAGNLLPGKYTARVMLQNRATSATMEIDEYTVTRLGDDAKAPLSYIDEHHRLIREGKPFFPLGMYWGDIEEKPLTQYADSPFNCLMPYSAPDKPKLDLAQKLGLKVIYTVKDVYAGTQWPPAGIKTEADEKAFITNAVNTYKSHPAVIGWYLNDELPAEMAARLNSHQTWVSELDPDHPTWVVLCTLGDVGKLTQSFDVIGTDPYPIPSPGPWGAGTWAAETRRQVQGTRAMWMVPQIFNWACYHQANEPDFDKLRPPTLPEMRSMAWQCIAEGATGLIFYSWFDIQKDKKVPFDTQWALCKQMGAEIKRYVPALLSIDPTPQVQAKGGKWLHWTVKAFEGRTYLFAVNDGQDEGDATFTVPGLQRLVHVRDEHRAISPSKGAFTDHFDKLALHVYEMRQ